ncbi:helix-turn-helix domain-containing protein [Daejeonella sp.]|uniref:helix-turn-helix domain-containing protein n=1 Tax=Daejeonella sp. TaxID=2805397 RepID=UPI00272FD067|nr:helix-turn-helix transcriptional regulator [Daejeonella sp.]MDP2413841.1 helix-turn-helix transcriptional regulator [Daejeonella sp.]
MNGSRNNEYITAFGNNLRALRKAKGLSMEKLAQEAGIEYSQVSDIELGKINTTVSTICLLSKGLGVSPKDLFDF